MDQQTDKRMESRKGRRQEGKMKGQKDGGRTNKQMDGKKAR